MENRNWTIKEIKLFCEVLIDLVNNFMRTLEKKALKKASTQEVFKEISGVFQEALAEPVFI